MGRELEGSILTSPKGPTKMAFSLLLYLFNERSLNAHCVPATQDIAVSYTNGSFHRSTVRYSWQGESYLSLSPGTHSRVAGTLPACQLLHEGAVCCLIHSVATDVSINSACHHMTVSCLQSPNTTYSSASHPLTHQPSCHTEG